MYKFIFSVLIFCFLGLTVSSAQTVVLINGVPTKVELAGSEIVKVIGVENNYMAGFSNTQNDYQTVDPSTGAVSSPIATTSTSSTITSATTTTSTVISQPVESPTAAPIVSGNYFKFDRNSALLSQLAINEIKDYATKVTSGQASNITLQSFYTTNNKRSEQLTKNRLEACKKYLELNGVSPTAITVESIPNDRQSDKVSITLQ